MVADQVGDDSDPALAEKKLDPDLDSALKSVSGSRAYKLSKSKS